MSKVRKCRVRCVICGSSEEHRSYHKFPSKHVIREQWLLACNSQDRNYSSSARICEKHFGEDDFELKKEGGRKRLKKNAIPTQFLQNSCEYGIETDKKEGRRKYSCILCRTCDPHRSYHKFPFKDKVLCEKWCTACNIQILPNDNISARLCDKHFKKEDFWPLLQAGGRRRLKKNIVPIQFLESNLVSESAAGSNYDSTITNSERSNEVLSSNITSSISELSTAFHDHDFEGIVSPYEDNTALGSCISTPPMANSMPTKKCLWRYPADIHTPHIQTPHSARQSVEMLKRIIKKQNKTIKTLKEKCRRKSARIENLQGIVNHLKRRNLLSQENTQHLLDSLPPAMKYLTMRKLVGKTKKFDPHVRKFALTLSFYSPKAYEYVRKTWGNLLPDPSTIRKWSCTVSCTRGSSEDVLAFLKKKPNDSICNLVTDEVSLHEQMVMENGEVYGHVNLDVGDKMSVEDIEEEYHILYDDEINFLL